LIDYLGSLLFFASLLNFLGYHPIASLSD
jgi:hypothetical protein